MNMILLLLAFLAVPETENQVRFCWMGAPTSDGFQLKAGIQGDPENVCLLVSKHLDLSDSIRVKGEKEGETGIYRFTVSGLKPDRTYFYVLEVDGRRATDKRGKAHTFPEGQASFSLAFGSCTKEKGMNHQVFETIRKKNPLFFLHLGDLHYEDIAVDDPALFRAAFNQVFAAPKQARLYREIPLVYMWDDHDFGPNNSDTLAPGKESAALVYREYVPHYPLPDEEAVYHAFSVGRVRFIVTDVRSQRTPFPWPDDGHKTMLGEKQKRWFKKELLEAGKDHPLIVWVNPIPWIGNTPDGWSWYSRERKELADFIAENKIKGLCMLSGDAHMLAIDDGTNTNYAGTQGKGFPVMHASSFGSSASVKGGPYSEGAAPGSGQFGWMDVEDRGSEGIQVRWQGFDHKDCALIMHSFHIPDN